MGVCFQCLATVDGVPRRRSCLEAAIDDVPDPIDPSADVIVIGAGPAGIAAAVQAAGAGRRVVVLDAAPHAGGQIWRHRDRRTLPRVARAWLDRFDRSGAALVRAEVVDPRSFLGRTTILATGARERYLPFPGWTLPGVIGIGGAQALIKKGKLDVAGRRVVIAGTGALMLPVAGTLARAGARVLLVAEQAPARQLARLAWRSPRRVVDAVAYRAAFARTPYRTALWVTSAESAPDGLRVTLSNDQRVTCDVLCTGYGLVPSTELARLAGCATASGVVAVDDRQATTVARVYCAGEPTGVAGVDAALVQGAIAGRAAAGVASSRELVAERDRRRAFARDMDRAFALRPELRALADASTIVCRCEDVPIGALDPSWAPRQAKLYTRVGMGPCQGRVCGPALEYLYGWPPDTPRPPLFPTSVRALL